MINHLIKWTRRASLSLSSICGFMFFYSLWARLGGDPLTNSVLADVVGKTGRAALVMAVLYFALRFWRGWDTIEERVIKTPHQLAKTLRFILIAKLDRVGGIRFNVEPLEKLTNNKAGEERWAIRIENKKLNDNTDLYIYYNAKQGVITILTWCVGKTNDAEIYTLFASVDKNERIVFDSDGFDIIADALVGHAMGAWALQGWQGRPTPVIGGYKRHYDPVTKSLAVHPSVEDETDV